MSKPYEVECSVQLIRDLHAIMGIDPTLTLQSTLTSEIMVVLTNFITQELQYSKIKDRPETDKFRITINWLPENPK